MKKLFFLFASLLITAGLTAQGINMSGSWILNNSKSKLNDQFTFAPREMVIEQADNSLKIEKHSTFQEQEFVMTDKYTLDGKECVNTAFQDTQKKSVCSWSDDRTSLKVSSKIVMQDGTEITINEVYKLDGATLVVESSASSSYGDMSETMVYDKKQ